MVTVGGVTLANRYITGAWEGFLNLGGSAAGNPNCSSVNSTGKVACFAEAYNSEMKAVITENLVCMPTLSAGDTDRGILAAAIRRRWFWIAKRGVQRQIRSRFATRLLWFRRRTEATIAEEQH
jgi:hypothetical protein